MLYNCSLMFYCLLSDSHTLLGTCPWKNKCFAHCSKVPSTMLAECFINICLVSEHNQETSGSVHGSVLAQVPPGHLDGHARCSVILALPLEDLWSECVTGADPQHVFAY